MEIFLGCFRINPQKKREARTEVQEKNLVQHKNSIPKSTCSPDSKMAWGDQQPNYLCSPLLHVSEYSVLPCSFSVASTNLLGTGFWMHQYAEGGAAHHVCLQCPGKGLSGRSPKDTFGPCVTWLVSSRQDGMVAQQSGKFPAVLAYNPKQVTSKLKLPFYSSKRFLCEGSGRLEIWRLTVVSPRIL